MDEIARLRPDLSLTKASPEASQPYVLHDQILGRRLRLDATTAAVAGALDGRNTLAEVAALTGLNPDQLRSTLARFTRLHLLDDALSQALVAGARGILAHQTADAEDVPLVIRDDARFSCTMCGSCCGGHNVGPVMEDVLEGLDPHAAALERETASPKGLFFSMGGRPGEDVLCHSVEGSCVFLDEEGLCRIHARLGAEAKPRGCRLFPYLFVTTPKGVRVSISSECRGFVEARAGKSLREREPELRRLLSLVPSRERVPARINARGGAVLSWGAYEALEQALHAQVEASDTSEDPTAQLLAMRQLIEDHCGVGETTKVRDFEGLSHALEQLTRSVCDACAEMREQLAAAPPGRRKGGTTSKRCGSELGG